MTLSIGLLYLTWLTFSPVMSLFDALDCVAFNTLHCKADCSNIPTKLDCESVVDDELHQLLTQYSNITSTPLRLTIRKSADLHLSQNLFAPVVNQLWDLRIESDTIINEIPSGSFNGLKNVRFLDLSGNKIAHLHAEDFAGLNQIRGIKLERNPLIQIAAGVFDDLNNLRCIDLDDNALTCDCRTLWLKKWSISHPNFWEDDQELYENAGPDQDCDGDIPDCEYPPIMRDRNVTEIPSDICDTAISDMECMELQTSHCKTYCDNWTPMQIQCTNVGYAELKGILSRYSQLTDRPLRLDIARSANLALNTSLWEPVKDQLIHLHLDHSAVLLRPNSFANLRRLVFLELSDDELAVIPRGTFEGLTALKGLSLDDSSVEHIDEGAFAPLTSLACLKLDDHDDHAIGLCDCDMQWLRGWTSNHTQVFDEKVLMYDYGLKVFCDGDDLDCPGKEPGTSQQDDCS
ncbi:slit homolog 3 protein-like [Paramacrobiotus metropolitanus]|uniref:slit homolog 3 protein-like n=1 Tax=Paramacrobiotus metropolitanus TaxID=2943436 RepID=UPI002445CCB4|nr:slit homolog 3 protein-like [Paramacrobiotus metropolitanus]